MIEQVKDWLPHDVVTRDVVRITMDRAVAAWSKRWFAKSSYCVSSILPCVAEARGEADSSGWRLLSGAVAVACSSWGSQLLAEKALDASIDRAALCERDRHLIEGLEKRLLEDLALQIERTLEQEPDPMRAASRVRDPFYGGGGVVVRLGEASGVDVVSVAVPFSALLPLCRSSLGAPDRTPATLVGLTAALASVPVTLTATLGRVEVGLADLRNLGVGDVLVLDTGLEDPVQIVGPNADPLARAGLVNANGEIALMLH